MTDYSNWYEWKEVTLYKSTEYFQQFKEYSPEDVKAICDKLIQKGEESGLEGCYLKFNSQMEPYENYLSDPSVSVVGYRRLNDAEKQEIYEDDAIREMAEQLNISEYEARILKSLRDKGVV